MVETLYGTITPPMRQRMAELEARDGRDRLDGTPKMARLRQVSPKTGRLLSILAANSPPGAILEIGTSAGYSTLWLALAARQTVRKVTTFELLPEKVALARETFRIADIEPVVQLVEGDVLETLPAYDDVAFCFLDTEKDLYPECARLVIPRLVPGGLFVVDNVISHQEELQPWLDSMFADMRLDCAVLPVGQGLLLARKGKF